MTRIYSVASKQYMDKYEEIFGKKEQEQKEEEKKEPVEKEDRETYAERFRRLEDVGDKLSEKKPQTKEEIEEILKSMSSHKEDDHITPSNKMSYKPDVCETSLLGRLWNVFTAIIGR